jgi:hypothetical protein
MGWGLSRIAAAAVTLGASESYRAVAKTADPGDLPAIASVPSAPDGDPRIAAAEAAEREAQLRAKGKASTIMTSGAGDTSKPNLVRRVLGFG